MDFFRRGKVSKFTFFDHGRLLRGLWVAFWCSRVPPDPKITSKMVHRPSKIEPKLSLKALNKSKRFKQKTKTGYTKKKIHPRKTRSKMLKFQKNNGIRKFRRSSESFPTRSIWTKKGSMRAAIFRIKIRRGKGGPWRTTRLFCSPI